MRWQIGRRSQNVEDRRGGATRLAAGGGIATLVIALLSYWIGGDPRALVGALEGPQEVSSGPGIDDEAKEFVRSVLASTEDVWNEEFRRLGREYEMPRLVLFGGAVQSACGFADSAVGPFYCPGDRQVYLDTAFFNDLHQRFGAPGDFAQAYVIAHEVGHHVQNLLGISDRVHAERGRASETEYNQLSVRLELQADFFAGLWAHHAQRKFAILEPGDIDEALGAASAIGDDRLQKKARGHVTPDSFTHGTSAQRARWFRKGFESGDFEQGDTFRARDL